MQQATCEKYSNSGTHSINMNTNNIYLGKEGQDKLIYAINRVADSARITLGAKGENGILQSSLLPGHIVTNDGVSIVRQALFDDPVEQIGANLLKEVSMRTDKQSGDGTTTSVVLTQAIIEEALKQGVKGVELKKSFDACLPIIEQLLDDQKKEVDLDSVKAVATISAESETLGGTIAQIYKEIGKNGIIEIDNSRTFETFYKINEGIRFQGAAMMSPYMANKDGQAVYENPYILITEQRISTQGDLTPIVEKLVKKGITELVVVCDDIDLAVLSALMFTAAQGVFKVLVIKAPTVMKDAFFEDFTIATGGKIVNEISGITLKTVEISDLGTCKKMTASREQTTLVGIKDVSAHIEDLKKKDDAISEFRVKRLNTKLATLFMGSNSEVELSYLRLKAEDAVNAAKLALQDGVVVGGGVALLNVANSLPDTLGGKVLKEALKKPIKQIIENCGVEYNQHLENAFGGSNGFNAKTGAVVDMWEAQIIDPVVVTKNAVRNAISVAGTVLTAGVVLTLPPQKVENQSPFGM